MRPTQSVQLGDEVHRLVKVKAASESRSVREVVVAAVEAYLGVTTCPTCHRPWPTRLDVTGTTGGKATVASPTRVPLDPDYETLPVPPFQQPPPVASWPAPEEAVQVEARCKRCGHLARQHWAKGCVAKCLCSEARYRA